MGQIEELREQYITEGDVWSPDLTVEQRRDRWPFQSSYALGLAERAHEAVRRAREDAAVAEQVLAAVKEQAVFALMPEGLSVRLVGGAIGLFGKV